MPKKNVNAYLFSNIGRHVPVGRNSAGRLLTCRRLCFGRAAFAAVVFALIGCFAFASTAQAANLKPLFARITAAVVSGADQSTTVEVGGSVSGGIPESDFGLDLSYSQATETGSSSSTVISCPATPLGDATRYWIGCLVPMVYTLKGTGKQLGPYGIVATDTVTKVKAAPPEYNAECVTTRNNLALPDPIVPVAPVQPW
jgi:hypothetical protein